MERDAAREDGMSSELNFVRQQGFEEATSQDCGFRFPALMWQPRIMGGLILVGLVLQSGAWFLALSAIAWWSVVLPRLNPFDALYNRLVARPKGRPLLTAAPAPRRFAQGMAGTFMLAIGLSLLAGWSRTAWTLEALLVVALVALIVGRFCLGSFVYLLITGQPDLARKTLPWAHGEPLHPSAG
jgi:hypothetical protein